MSDPASAIGRDTATALRDGFLRTSRSAQVPNHLLITNGLFDLDKIYGIYDDAGVEYRRYPIAPWRAVCTEHQIADTPRNVTWQPPARLDHYIFNMADGYLQRVLPWHLFRIRDGFVSYDITRPGQPEFYFFTAGGEAINGLFFGGQPFLEDPGWQVETPCVFADDFFVRFNICHLLFDKLPRIHTAQTLAGAQTALLFSAPGYVADLCGLFGITAVAPPPGRRRGTIALRDCLIFSDSFNGLKHPGRFGGPRHLDTLAALRAALPPALDGPKRYFLHREPPLPRVIENAAAVARILDRHGFHTGDPAALAPLDQMRMFLNVEMLGGVHGAGLANLAFQSPGSTVIELLPPLCATRAYWAMSQKTGLDYHHLVCDDPELGTVNARAQVHDVRNNRRNVVVPEAAFEALLAGLDA
ncbi:MAG: glycosyltransferase family 61 protein [Rhodobacter sp.]|nr:glycosyltransferase family 61 protein [Rhodobacter sp.]